MKNAFLILFFNKDLSLHNLFKEFLFRGFNEILKTNIFFNGKIFVTQFTRIKERKIIDLLFSFSPLFKTKPADLSKEEFLNLPQPTISFLFDCSSEVKTTAFRIAMSCDGSIGISSNKGVPSPRLRLACAHPKLIHEWRFLSKDIGLNMMIEKDRNTWSGLHVLITNKTNDILHFKQLGGFLPTDVEVSRGNFIGHSKNSVLDLAIRLINR